MQRIANLVDLEKPCKMTIWLLSWLSIQPRTSPLKFDHFVVKSEKGSISNLSTKSSFPWGVGVRKSQAETTEEVPERVMQTKFDEVSVRQLQKASQLVDEAS